MRPIDVEAWALQVIETVRDGRWVEDSRVELKSTWPSDAAKAARRLAGHANAARGSRILWLIGVDEASGEVGGVRAEEMSTWWQQVATCFAEDAYPAMTDVVVHGAGGVVALGFETELAPYLVKVPGGGPVELEAPWREGTRVRTARRSELLLTLSKAVELPDVEIVKATAVGEIMQTDSDALYAPDELGALELRVRLDAYVEVPPGASVTFPYHRCSFEAMVPEINSARFEFVRVGARTPSLSTATASSSELTLSGPAMVVLDVVGRFLAFPPGIPAGEPLGDLRVTGELPPSGSDVSVRIDTTILDHGERQPTEPDVKRSWVWDGRVPPN